MNVNHHAYQPSGSTFGQPQHAFQSTQSSFLRGTSLKSTMASYDPSNSIDYNEQQQQAQSNSEVIELFKHQMGFFSEAIAANAKLEDQIKRVLDLVEQMHIFNGIFLKFCHKIEDQAHGQDSEENTHQMNTGTQAEQKGSQSEKSHERPQQQMYMMMVEELRKFMGEDAIQIVDLIETSRMLYERIEQFSEESDIFDELRCNSSFKHPSNTNFNHTTMLQRMMMMNPFQDGSNKHYQENRFMQQDLNEVMMKTKITINAQIQQDSLVSQNVYYIIKLFIYQTLYVQKFS